MCVIEIPDNQAAALRAKAAAEGLSLEAWLAKLSGVPAPQGSLAAVAKLVRSHMEQATDLASMPADGAAEHDHYIYGTPKRGS